MFKILALVVGLTSVLGASAARADFTCRTADGQSDVVFESFTGENRVRVHSTELAAYAQVAYQLDLGRLELVREVDGNSILTFKDDGLEALLYAPAAGRPDLTWYLELKRQGSSATATLYGSDQHQIQLTLTCN